MAGTYLGDTWIEDPAEPIQPQDAIMADPKNAAAVAALLAQYGPLGKLSSVHIGDSQYSNEWNGRSLQNSKYGLYSGGEGGNVIWDGSNWVPVPDAGGSLFGDFIGDIAKFGGAALGAYGLASGLGGLLRSVGAAAPLEIGGSIGSVAPGDMAGMLAANATNTGLSSAAAAGLEAGTISAADASAAMGSGVDAAGWGSGALDVLGAAEATSAATGLEAGANAGSELYGLEVGGEGVGSGLETLADSGYIDTLGGAGEVVDSNFYFDDWGVGSNAAGDITNAAGNRAWQDVAAETLRDLGIPRETAAKMVTGLSSSITSITDPKNAKQLISKLTGGSTNTRAPTRGAAAGASGGAGGINIFNAGGDDSGLADAMKIFSGGRSGMDSVVQAMSQSGKGN